MQMGVKLQIKRFFVGSFLLFERLNSKVFYWKLQLKKGVTIAKSARLASNVLIDTNFGGNISIGSDTEILHGTVILTYGGNIKIGDFCSINPYTIIYGHGNTIIGNNVLIAGSCMLIPSNHNYSRNDIPINKQGANSIGITIEDDVWIGHGCSILDGVTIGRGSIVAAGSVVTKNVSSMDIVAGVPAKIIGNRNEK